jgi:hypothetical protein
MAITTIFCPISVDTSASVAEFSGAGLGYNNPTREILKEAQDMYGRDQSVAIVLSIGSGLPKEASFKDIESKSNRFDEILEKVIVDCEKVQQDLSHRVNGLEAYIRLNVDRGLDEVQMHDWDQLGVIMGHTQAYISKSLVENLIDTSIRLLEGRQGSIFLDELSKSLILGFHHLCHFF